MRVLPLRRSPGGCVKKEQKQSDEKELWLTEQRNDQIVPDDTGETESDRHVLQPIFHLMSTYTPGHWLDIRDLAGPMNNVTKGSV
jgi:hypothetical protein